MKQQNSNRTEPRDYLYDVGYKKKDGQVRMMGYDVTIKKGLKILKNYKRLLDAGVPFANEVEHLFMIPKL